MDSNSTVVLIPHCSLQKGERCGVKADQSAMDIYNDNYSGSDHCIADPVFVTSRLRIESQMAAFREHEKEQHPVSSSLQENNLFHDSLIVSGAKPRPRNPWAALGSLAFLYSHRAGGNCRSAASHGSTPQEGNADDVVSAATTGCGWESREVPRPQARVHEHPDKHWHYCANA